MRLFIIQQIRNSIKYVATMYHKSFMACLKPVYHAVSKAASETALDDLKVCSGQPYLSGYFRYLPDIRRVIYTANAIESVHRKFRKLTKPKGAFSNDNSLLKLPLMGFMNAQEKWAMPIQSWNLALSQLAIYFEGRLNSVMPL